MGDAVVDTKDYDVLAMIGRVFADNHYELIGHARQQEVTIKGLRTQVERLTLELSEKDVQVSDLKADLDVAIAKMDALREDNDALSETVSNLTKTMKDCAEYQEGKETEKVVPKKRGRKRKAVKEPEVSKLPDQARKDEPEEAERFDVVNERFRRLGYQMKRVSDTMVIFSHVGFEQVCVQMLSVNSVPQFSVNNEVCSGFDDAVRVSQGRVDDKDAAM